MTKPATIPASLRDLHANWLALSQDERLRAYALNDIAEVSGAMLAAYEEAKALPGGDVDLFRCSDAETKRYYAVHGLYHWLREFLGRQGYFVQTGVMAKLRAKIEREAEMLRFADVPEAEISNVLRRIAA